MTIQNKLIQQAHDEVEKNVTDRESYDKIMESAMRVIYDKKVFEKIVKGIEESDNPVEDAAKGVVAILGAMAEKAQGTIPPEAAIQAGYSVLLDALDFMEQAGVLEIDKDAIARATMEYFETLLPSIGLTAEKLSAAMEQVKGVVSDPKKMSEYQQWQKLQKGGA